MSPSFFSFHFIEIKRCSEQNSLACIWRRGWGISRKSGKRVRKPKTGRFRDAQRDKGKRKGPRCRDAQISACPLLPPFRIQRFANQGWDGGAPGSSHSPRPPSVWSLARQGLANPSPGRRRHRAELLGPRLAQRQCSWSEQLVGNANGSWRNRSYRMILIPSSSVWKELDIRFTLLILLLHF